MSSEVSSHFSSPQENANDVRLALKTWVEVEDYLKQCQGIILPIGSIEQHGPTGAIGTDAMTAEAVALLSLIHIYEHTRPERIWF